MRDLRGDWPYEKDNTLPRGVGEDYFDLECLVQHANLSHVFIKDAQNGYDKIGADSKEFPLVRGSFGEKASSCQLVDCLF